MKLNIYKISHPIIQLLSNASSIDNKNNILSKYYCKNLGLFFMYEILRKHIKINTIYIKSLYSTRQLKLINYNEKYLIATDLSNTYEIVSDIKTLLPNIDIMNINYNNLLSNSEVSKSLKEQEQRKNTKIFIVEKELSSINIMNTIKHLILKKEVDIENINIACITSEHSELKQLGNRYPNVKVYTTEIVNKKYK